MLYALCIVIYYINLFRKWLHDLFIFHYFRLLFEPLCAQHSTKWIKFSEASVSDTLDARWYAAVASF